MVTFTQNSENWPGKQKINQQQELFFQQLDNPIQNVIHR